MKSSSLSLQDVLQARVRIADGLRLTPCNFAESLSEIAGMRVYAKRDYEQVTGSFKERGARNALLSLSAVARAAGVVAASAGNHALGLAFHGRSLGIAVTVVMPVNAPQVKAQRCRELGAHVLLHGTTFQEAAVHARQLSAETGMTAVHPFDDRSVMAGQGTLALEALEQAPDMEALIVPCGGGGLLAGCAVVVKALRPEIEVISVEPAHAPSFAVALHAGHPVPVPVSTSVADGLSVSTVGLQTFSVAAGLVDRAVTVTEDELAGAMLALAETEGTVLEGAGAAPLAACLSGKLDHLKGRRVGLVLGGRNIDPAVHRKALARARHERAAA